MRIQSRTMILLFAAFLLPLGGGCGGGSGSQDPQGGEKQKQARINAYGQAGAPTGKATITNTASSNNPQASARQRAQGGR